MLDRKDRVHARLATLCGVSRALARPLDTIGVLRAVYMEMARVLDVTICFFGTYDAVNHSVDVIWQVHDGTELPGGQFPLGAGATSRAIRNCQPQLIRRWSEEGPPVQLQYATDRPGLPESCMVAPVVFDGAPLGILELQSYAPDAYDQEDLALVQSIADQIGVVIGASRGRRVNHSRVGSLELESVVASMPEALLVLDASGRLIRVNPAARRLLGETHTGIVFGHPINRAEMERAFDVRVSPLMRDGSPAGTVMLLREPGSSTRLAAAV